MLLDHSRGLRGVFETADDGLVTVQIGLYGFRHDLRARGENQASRQDWTLTDELPEPGKHCYPPLCTTSDWVHIFLTKKSSISVLHPQRALRVEPQGPSSASSGQALRSAFFQSARRDLAVPGLDTAGPSGVPFDYMLRALRAEPQGEQALRPLDWAQGPSSRTSGRAGPSTICSGPFEQNLRASRPSGCVSTRLG